MTSKGKHSQADKVLALIMEYGIYLLIVFLFTHKGEAFRSLGIYIPPIALVIRSCISRQAPLQWKHPLLLLLVAFSISAVIAACFSPEPLAFVEWLRKSYLKVFLIVVVIASSFGKRKLLQNVLQLMSVLSLFFIVMTFYDFLTKALGSNSEILFDNIRSYNPILAYMLPFIPYSILTNGNKMLKIFWSLVLCAGVSALLLTGFRGGWISFGVSMVVWGAWLFSQNTHKTILIILAGIVLTALITVSILPSSHIGARIKQGFSTTNRYEWIWKPYIHTYGEFTMTQKIFGSGMTHKTMNKNMEEYRQGIEDFPVSANIPLNTHNNYLRILLRQGVLGFILYIMLLTQYVRLIIHAVRKQDFFADKAMGVCILCPFVGEYIVHGLVEDLKVLPLGLLLGLAIAYTRLNNENRQRNTQ